MYTRVYNNETVNEWCGLLDKTVEAVPDVDSDRTIILMDDFRGGQGVLKGFKRKVRRFLCAHHREQGIIGSLGVNASTLPIQALHVKTPEELDTLKKQYPKRTKEYMSGRPDAQQYRCKCEVSALVVPPRVLNLRTM